MSDRFAQKLEQKRRKSRRRIGAGIAAVLVLVGLGWLVFASSVFAVNEVQVSGTEYLAQEKVLKAAAVPTGEPLLRLDLAAIGERVEELALVESVQVARDFPNTVQLTVTERTAVAWLSRGGDPWAVDYSGEVFRQLSIRPAKLPQLEVDSTDEATVAAAAKVAAQVSAEDSVLAGSVKSISAKSKDSIELTLSKGRTIVWGSAEDAEAKLRVLQALLETKASVYDVSAPERPTTLTS